MDSDKLESKYKLRLTVPIFLPCFLFSMIYNNALIIVLFLILLRKFFDKKSLSKYISLVLLGHGIKSLCFQKLTLNIPRELMGYAGFAMLFFETTTEAFVFNSFTPAKVKRQMHQSYTERYGDPIVYDDEMFPRPAPYVRDESRFISTEISESKFSKACKMYTQQLLSGSNPIPEPLEPEYFETRKPVTDEDLLDRNKFELIAKNDDWEVYFTDERFANLFGTYYVKIKNKDKTTARPIDALFMGKVRLSDAVDIDMND